jgi:hypothetical protein
MEDIGDPNSINGGLRLITKKIYDSGEDICNGCFGGLYGYGPPNFSNDIFQFHAFCWCEKDDCPWCNCNEDGTQDWEKYGVVGFTQGAPNFWHKASGMRIWWYKYIGRGMEVEKGSQPWHEVLKECLDSIKGQPHA